MKKLTLKMDDLRVDSFQTGQVRVTTGTVHGANTGTRCEPWSEFWTCGIWCPPTTDPQATGPCQCPNETDVVC